MSDLDGTIIDVRERFAHAQVATFASMGYQVHFERILQLFEFGLDAEKLLEKLGISFSSEEWQEFYLQVDDEFYSHWEYSQVFPGVIDALHTLKPRVQATRLITSRNRIEETNHEFHFFGIDQFFDRVHTRKHLALAEGVKEIPLYPFLPHRRRLIQLAIADVEVRDNVWVVGDSSGEMEAAKSLGYITVGVLTGYSKRKDLEPHTDYIITSLAELPNLL